MSREPLLTARGVSVTLGGRTVVAGVDLQLQCGEWLALIGPNGAGKSTLLAALAGLRRHEGEVRLSDGRRPGATDIAVVPQSPLLPDGMTVLEYVLTGRTAHLRWLARESAKDRELAVDVLQRLDLSRFAGREVTTLSGGEAQRVVIARSLVQQAGILLLDEPTSALDLGHQSEVLDLVDRIRDLDGLTVVAAMHDLSTAARYADRLMLIDAGTVVAEGAPAAVLEPTLLSGIYRTPLQVNEIDGEVVVLPASRRNRAESPVQDRMELP